MPMVVVTEEDEPIKATAIVSFAQNHNAFLQGYTPTGNNEYLILLPEEYQFDNKKGEEYFYTGLELLFDTRAWCER
jgi:hypothetical protein